MQLAHHWGGRLGEMGHGVVLLPPHRVRPYVTRNKTDRADAKGILEAYRNEDIRPVPVRAIEQRRHNRTAIALANKLARIA